MDSEEPTHTSEVLQDPQENGTPKLVAPASLPPIISTQATSTPITSPPATSPTVTTAPQPISEEFGRTLTSGLASAKRRRPFEGRDRLVVKSETDNCKVSCSPWTHYTISTLEGELIAGGINEQHDPGCLNSRWKLSFTEPGEGSNIFKMEQNGGPCDFFKQQRTKVIVYPPIIILCLIYILLGELSL